MKIYDKTWEAREKHRKVDNNVLRIETIYKRQKVPIKEFESEAFCGRLATRFMRDWLRLEFVRHVESDKGMKQSQIEKAKQILDIGVEAYLAECKRLYNERRITKKTWETCRIFARSWPDIADKFRMDEGRHEREYRNKFRLEFQAVNQ